MGNIEQLFSRGSEYKGTFDRKRNATESPVHALARIMAETGREGLVSFVDRKTDSHGNTVLDQRFYQSANREVGKEWLAIHLGASIIMLQYALVEGNYDVGLHATTINAFTTGAPMFAVPDKSGIEPLSLAQQRKMRQEARENPSLATFFLGRQDLLPSKMREYLKSLNVLRIIPRVAAPYGKFYEQLVGEPVPLGQSEILSRIEFLAKKDREIQYFRDEIARRIGTWVNENSIDTTKH